MTLAAPPKEAIHQGLLERAVHALFPSGNISINVRKEAKVKNPSTGSFLEIDVWVPEALLGFEFQDTYHYETTWESHVPLENVRHKDHSKLEGVRARGETLIVVPCWWDGGIYSLKSSVAFQRPDLFGSNLTPIALNAPHEYFKSGPIPGASELMLASFPSTFHIETDTAEYYTWWMGEKYDGVRCCWQPVNQILYSRSGFQLDLPSQIYHLFPPNFLDGEIWFGRGFFSEAQKTVYAPLFSIDWSLFRVITFDIPDPHMHGWPFEKRYGNLIRALDCHHSFIILGYRTMGESKLRVTESIHHIISNEGEGVILRKPHSYYEPGRTEALLKLKASRSDREALVVDARLDKSLLLQLPTGETFTVPQKNVQTEVPPLRGDIVSFTFENYRNLMPFNTKVVRIRKDISWKEVLRDSSVHVPKSQALTEKTMKVVDAKYKPISYGKMEKRKTARLFFERIAKANNLDPLSPESWYSVSQKQIQSTKDGRSVLLQYNGSYIKALVSTFPDVSFDVRKFAFMPLNFWSDVRNRRQFFMNVAQRLGFDPLVASNWYRIDDSDISMHKGAASVEFYYRGGFVKALMHLFPEIGLDVSKFVAFPYNHWANEQHRRSYLERFAQSRGFNPLNPEHWYIMLRDRLFSTKNFGALLAFYKGSMTNALLRLFPHIGLNTAKLLTVSRYHWKEVTNRRNFFVYLAKEKGFDPLVARNWYAVSAETVASSMGASSVLAYYSDSYVEALLHLFPEIGLDPTKFSYSTRNHLVEAAQRRKLEQLARQRGFDPLVAANWYSLPKEALASMKGGSTILFSYGHSFSRAVMHLFPEIQWDIRKFRRKRNHWEIESNRKEFFMDFAAAKGIDPLKAEVWYKVSASSVLETKGADAVLRHYSGHFGQAIFHLFPNIEIDLSRFTSRPKERWHDVSARRKFFLDIANFKSFNPLEPKNWYSLTHDAVIKFKGARSILWHYGGSLVKALIDLFPEVDFDTRKFTHTPYGFWKEEKNRRAFFLQFANEENFSPLVASNWYNMVEKISKSKGINSVLHHHSGSISNALVQLFPDVHFDDSQFTQPRFDSYWLATQNRRKFFKEFASASSFDPLVAANWYRVSKASVLAHKGAKTVLDLYKGSLPKALMSSFPDIGLIEKKFVDGTKE